MLDLVITILRLLLILHRTVSAAIDQFLETALEHCQERLRTEDSAALAAYIDAGISRQRALELHQAATTATQTTYDSPLATPVTNRSPTDSQASSVTYTEEPATPPHPATPDTASTITLPTSPSAYRGQRVSNNLLRAEFARTGICGHYSHEVARTGTQPRIARCPACLHEYRSL